MHNASLFSIRICIGNLLKREVLMSSVLKGNFKVNKEVKEKKKGQDTLEEEFESEAMKHFGGSIAFVRKKKVNWELK